MRLAAAWTAGKRAAAAAELAEAAAEAEEERPTPPPPPPPQVLAFELPPEMQDFGAGYTDFDAAAEEDVFDFGGDLGEPAYMEEPPRSRRRVEVQEPASSSEAAVPEQHPGRARSEAAETAAVPERPTLLEELEHRLKKIGESPRF